jgi:hypothetical protein
MENNEKKILLSLVFTNEQKTIITNLLFDKQDNYITDEQQEEANKIKDIIKIFC